MVSLDLCKECLNLTKIRTSVHEFHTFSGRPNYYLVVCSTVCNGRSAGTKIFVKTEINENILLVCKLYQFLTLRVLRQLQIFYHTIQGVFRDSEPVPLPKLSKHIGL